MVFIDFAFTLLSSICISQFNYIISLYTITRYLQSLYSRYLLLIVSFKTFFYKEKLNKFLGMTCCDPVLGWVGGPQWGCPSKLWVIECKMQALLYLINYYVASYINTIHLHYIVLTKKVCGTGLTIYCTSMYVDESMVVLWSVIPTTKPWCTTDGEERHLRYQCQCTLF